MTVKKKAPAKKKAPTKPKAPSSKIFARIFQVIGFLCVICFIGLILVMAFDGSNNDQQLSFKSDNEIKEIYKNNKPTFEKLVRFSEPCNRFSKDALHFTYPKICNELADKLSIFEFSFVRGHRHFFTDNMQSGYQKGFAYLEEPPEDIAESSFDSIPNDLDPYQNHYKKIEGKWYIVFYHINS